MWNMIENTFIYIGKVNLAKSNKHTHTRSKQFSLKEKLFWKLSLIKVLLLIAFLQAFSWRRYLENLFNLEYNKKIIHINIKLIIKC